MHFSLPLPPSESTLSVLNMILKALVDTGLRVRIYPENSQEEAHVLHVWFYVILWAANDSI